MIMRLVVGLGNPGEKYAKTRHNVGFMVVGSLNSKFEFSKRFEAEIAQMDEVIFAKPYTFMNESGRSVQALKHFYKVKCEDVYVVHDDLDIELGEFKLQFGKGPKIHYGVNSIEKTIGTSDFWRVRVGVENRKIRGNKGIPGEKYSLQNFRQEEEEILSRVIEQVIEKLVSVVF